MNWHFSVITHLLSAIMLYLFSLFPISILANFKQSPIEFSDVEYHYRQNNCYSNQYQFLGCIKGLNHLLRKLNHLLELSEDNLILSPINTPHVFLVQNLPAEITRQLGTSIFIGEERYSQDNPEQRALQNLIPFISTAPQIVEDYSLAQANEIYPRLSQLNQAQAEHTHMWNTIWLDYFKQNQNAQNQLHFWNNMSQIMRFLETRLDQEMDELKTAEFKKQISGELINIKLANEFSPLTRVQPLTPLPAQALASIGANIIQDLERTYLQITDIIHQGPAHLAGLKFKDKILAIRQENETLALSINGMSKKRALRLLQGSPGSKVYLSVLRNNQSAPQEFLVIREVISSPPVSSSTIFVNNQTVWKIKLESFDTGVCQLLKNEINLHLPMNTKAVVLDLRGNKGGLEEEFLCIAPLFLGQSDSLIKLKLFYQTYNLQDGSTHFEFILPQNRELISIPIATASEIGVSEQKIQLLLDTPLLVQQNYQTASCAEFLSSALKDSLVQERPRAIILGERSFGKGMTQYQMSSSSVVPFINNHPGQFYFYLDYAEIFGKLGETIHLVGITPDLQFNFAPQFLGENPFAKRLSDIWSGTYKSQVSPRPDILERQHYLELIRNCTLAKKNKTDQVFSSIYQSAPIFKPNYHDLLTQNVLECLLP